MSKCKVAVYDIESIGSENQTNFDNLKNDISESLAMAEEHLQFVNLYLTKPKTVRKTMFYTIVGTVSKPN